MHRRPYHISPNLTATFSQNGAGQGVSAADALVEAFGANRYFGYFYFFFFYAFTAAGGMSK